MRVIALEETFRFLFSSRRFSTGASFTIASLAVEVYEDDSDTQITGADTSDDDYDGIAGLHEVQIAATAANGFEAGKWYTVVISAGTVDSVSVVGTVIYEFRIETVAEMVARLYQEKLYQTALVVEATGNTTSRVNLTNFVDAQTADGDLVGSAWDYFRAATNQWQRFVCVSVQSARLFNVVVGADGTALDNAVAANDFLFFAGWDALRSTAGGRSLDVASNGALDTDSVTAILTTAMTEAYAADGAAPTLAQALFLIQQCLTEFSVTTTTQTVNKLDGTTPAATFTLNSATTPSAITRAT